MMDKHGYPDANELQQIKNWPYNDFFGLMEFIIDDLGWDKHGWHKQEDGRYSMSCGGWSGNEEIISAMERNYIFWGQCWESSKKGGHHEFEIRNLGKNDDK